LFQIKRIVATFGGLSLFVAVVSVASGAPGTNGSNAQSNSVKTISHDCRDTDQGGGMQGDDMDNDGDTIAFSGATVLWPPNHKYRTVTITATDNGDGESAGDYTTLHTVTTSDQPELGPGSGHSTGDADPAVGDANGNGSASQDIALRGERAGMFKEGRTYTIKATATFDGMEGTDQSPPQPNMSERCSATFTVTVPHDMGNH
jgi:hypothetical protein